MDTAVENDKLKVSTSHKGQQIVVIGFSFYDEYMQQMLAKFNDSMLRHSMTESKFDE